MLSGHTDVVPVDGQPWTSDPWTLTDKGDGRLYGRGTVTAIADSPIGEQLLSRDSQSSGLQPRQVIDIFVEKTATSCGYAVPVMEFVRDRQSGDRGKQYKTYPKKIASNNS